MDTYKRLCYLIDLNNRLYGWIHVSKLISLFTVLLIQAYLLLFLAYKRLERVWEYMPYVFCWSFDYIAKIVALFVTTAATIIEVWFTYYLKHIEDFVLMVIT